MELFRFRSIVITCPGSNIKTNQSDCAGPGGSTVAFANIRRQPIFQRLRHFEIFPGITWGLSFKYNDWMPCKDYPEDSASESSVVSLEFCWMDYMAIGYESDEYYEADDESDSEETPRREKRKILRGRRSRYLQEAGTTRESIVRYFIASQ